jgi:glycosyltransferase involved in cell wall biosynthesis
MKRGCGEEHMDCCPVTIIVIAHNEEVNISHALKSVIGWARQVFVVDSYSTDRTVEIASECGAAVHLHPFESFCAQKNWAINDLPIETEWMLFLDADEYLSEEIKQEISRVLECVEDEVGGFITKMKFMYLGRWLKHGDLYRHLVRVVRKGKGAFIEAGGCREKLAVQGKLEMLQSYIVHDDHKTLHDWISKQMVRISIDAKEVSKTGEGGQEAVLSAGSGPITIEGGRSRWLKRRLLCLPGPVRPFAQFVYRYVLRLGFLDGWQGFIYHFLLQFWYPLMVEATVIELRYRQKCQEAGRQH